MIARVVSLMMVVLASILSPFPLGQDTATNSRVGDTVIDGGVLLGVNTGWEDTSIADFNARLGLAPAVYSKYIPFPLDQPALDGLQAFMDEATVVDGMVSLIVEPAIPLEDITEKDASDFAARLADFNAQGVSILLRFAPEMNGLWTAWGQQPVAYVDAFRLVADAVHTTAPRTAMVWAPNYGGGYPFAPEVGAEPGSAEFGAMDTDGDGRVTIADDPYAPYYPGDGYVDWVGMTMFHWGGAYPWGENEVPEPGKFVGQLRGTWIGANGDESYLPDFYDTYAAQTGKPLMVLTAALFNEDAPSDGLHVDIKREWWRQAFGSASDELPNLQLVEWFEWRHVESEAGGATIDWTLTENDDVNKAFRGDAPDLGLQLAPAGDE